MNHHRLLPITSRQSLTRHLQCDNIKRNEVPIYKILRQLPHTHTHKSNNAMQMGYCKDAFAVVVFRAMLVLIVCTLTNRQQVLSVTQVLKLAAVFCVVAILLDGAFTLCPSLHCAAFRVPWHTKKKQTNQPVPPPPHMLPCTIMETMRALRTTCGCR